MLSGTKSMLVTQDRMKGFNEVMATAPQFEVIEDQDTNWDPTLSGEIAPQLFAKYGCDGIQGAYGMADYMAMPIVQAAKQAGCKVGGKDGLVVTGSNCFKAGIDAIRAGEFYGTATEDPITIAKQTADYIERYFNGENPPQSELVQGGAGHRGERRRVRRAVQQGVTRIPPCRASAWTGLPGASAACRR